MVGMEPWPPQVLEGSVRDKNGPPSMVLPRNYSPRLPGNIVTSVSEVVECHLTGPSVWAEKVPRVSSLSLYRG